MNPYTGKTSGRHGGWKFSHTTPDGGGNAFSAWAGPRLHFVSVDGCKHCPHADRMRLRRLPKRLKPRVYNCFYCHSRIVVVLPCVCPTCGRRLHKDVLKMNAGELFLAARNNGLILSLKFVPKDEPAKNAG